jgi:uncharacterized protein (TIGR03067 family)
MIASALLLSLSFGFAADKDLLKVQGAWQVEKVVSKGKEVDSDGAKAISFVIEGNVIRRFVNGVDRKDPATIKMTPPLKRPGHIDLTSDNKGEPKMLGIYELDGDTLKWCFSPKKRPDKFESPEGSDITLIVMKKVRK